MRRTVPGTDLRPNGQRVPWKHPIAPPPVARSASNAPPSLLLPVGSAQQKEHHAD
jgi:hypothetical protein